MAEERKCNQSGCTGNCSSCSHAKQESTSLLEPPHPLNNIKHVIAVSSGKGGVGKSLVTAMLAVIFNRKGYKVGILDADITGPSIPKMFGINCRAKQNADGILPTLTANGIGIMSINLILNNPEDPVVWRGPVIGGAVKQFWTDVVWGDLDFLFVDMPPGTGDVPLTVFQSLPVDGTVIVSSPQELVSLIVKKAYNMANMMNIDILGLVENMSYIKCPDCDKEIYVFGKGKTESAAKEMGVDFLGNIPIDEKLSALVNEGEFERFYNDYLDSAAEIIEKKFM